MRKKNTPIAKRLRDNPTSAENHLWFHLRAKQLGGHKFRRQQPIGNYIVDFACLRQKLIIELDGGQHANQVQRDQLRDSWLRSQGFKVLRFWNNDVFENTEGVLETILQELSPSPCPSHQGRGD